MFDSLWVDEANIWKESVTYRISSLDLSKRTRILGLVRILSTSCPQSTLHTQIYTGHTLEHHNYIEEVTDFLQLLLNQVCHFDLADEAPCSTYTDDQFTSNFDEETSEVAMEALTEIETISSESGEPISSNKIITLGETCVVAADSLAVLYAMVQNFLDDVIDLVVSLLLVVPSRMNVNEEIFGDLALPFQNSHPLISAKSTATTTERATQPAASLSPTTVFSCGPYSPRTLLPSSFHCWHLHNPEAILTDRLLLPSEPYPMAGLNVALTRNLSYCWPIVSVPSSNAEMSLDLCTSDVWACVSSMSNIAIDRKISRPSRSCHSRRQEVKLARELSKLRSPYKRLFSSHNNSVSSHSEVEHQPIPSIQECDEVDSITIRDQKATMILRKPFRKHVLSPDAKQQMGHDLCTSQPVEYQRNVVNTTSSDPLVIHTSPRARRPFKRLTVSPTVHSDPVQAQYSSKHDDCRACHSLPKVAESTSVEVADTTSFVQPKKRRKIAPQLLLKTVEIKTRGSSTTSLDDDYAVKGFATKRSCTTPTILDVSVAHVGHQEVTLNPSTSGSSGDVQTNETSTSSNTDQNLDTSIFMPKDNISQPKAHSKHVLRVISPEEIKRTCTDKSELLTNSEGWETASGTRLDLAHDPVLAAEWRCSKEVLSMTPPGEIGAAQVKIVACDRQQGRSPMFQSPVSISTEKASVNDHLSLQKRQLTLKEDLKAVESALKCEESQDSKKLQALIRKWRAVAHDVCDEYFVHVDRRVTHAGGVQAWYKMQQPSQWYDDEAAESAARREVEATEYDLSPEEKRLMNSEEEYFTMDLLLRGLGIPIKLIGWNCETEQWIHS